MKLIRKAVELTHTGTKRAPTTICLIHNLPPKRAYNEPPKKPFIGEVTAYINKAVFNNEPRLQNILNLKEL